MSKVTRADEERQGLGQYQACNACDASINYGNRLILGDVIENKRKYRNNLEISIKAKTSVGPSGATYVINKTTGLLVYLHAIMKQLIP